MEDDRLYSTSPHWAYVDEVSDYLVSLFNAVLHGEKASLAAERLRNPTQATWSSQLQQDLIRAAKILASAWKFRVPMKWDADHLCAFMSKKPRGLNMEYENAVLETFPPLCSVDNVLQDDIPILMRPGIIVDSSDHVLAWALPGVLSEERQLDVLKATSILKTQLRLEGGTPEDPANILLKWRVAPTFFKKGDEWPAGSWLANPGGYAVGHKSAKFDPTPSSTMRDPAAHVWGSQLKECGALVSAILRVAHPRLYDAGKVSMSRMAIHPTVAAALGTWPTVFNKVHVISNRATPFHRDTSGMPPWYDLLMTVGKYDRAELVLRNLGVQIGYKPGTIALICSQVIHHGVGGVEGDRVCYSWFMTEAVHRNFDVPSVSWMRADHYHT